MDDTARETFATGRPLEDSLEIQQCKHCKKSILKNVAAAHVVGCLKAKREKAQRKKEQKEAREREKKAAGKEDDKDEEGDTKMEDDDDDDDNLSPEKKGPGGLKSTKKSAGKKVELDDLKKGKKRKAEGDAEKGPKMKKKKEEPKPKAPKQKGILYNHHIFSRSTFPDSESWLVLNRQDAASDSAFCSGEATHSAVSPKPEPETPTPSKPSVSGSASVRRSGRRRISTARASSASMSPPAQRPKNKRSDLFNLEGSPANKRLKGPVDVERQCGVIKDGVPCARSLTCKSHSMGAKRAVAGRSLPYDMLLAAYQKKNQAKQQSIFPPNVPPLKCSQLPQKQQSTPMPPWKMKMLAQVLLIPMKNVLQSWQVLRIGIHSQSFHTSCTSPFTEHTPRHDCMSKCSRQQMASHRTYSLSKVMVRRSFHLVILV